MPAPFFGRSMVKAIPGGISFSGSGIGCKVGGPELVDGGGGVQTFLANKTPILLLAKGIEACQKLCKVVHFKKMHNAKLRLLIETILVSISASYWKSYASPLLSSRYIEIGLQLVCNSLTSTLRSDLRSDCCQRYEVLPLTADVISSSPFLCTFSLRAHSLHSPLHANISSLIS
jgi:hypothetical protein